MKKILATIAFGLFTINAYAATFKCDSGFSLQISPSIESKFDIIVGYEGKEYPGIVRLGGKKLNGKSKTFQLASRLRLIAYSQKQVAPCAAGLLALQV